MNADDYFRAKKISSMRQYHELMQHVLATGATKTDRTGTGGATLNPKVKVATRQLALAFLNWLHGKDTAALERWSGENAMLLSQFEKVAL